MTDHYADGTYRWWHLSVPSPELLDALSDRWLPAMARALDVGCGLGTEAAYLHELGWAVVGVDLSRPAVLGAVHQHSPGPAFFQADALHLPFRSSAFDVALDVSRHVIPSPRRFSVT